MSKRTRILIVLVAAVVVLATMLAGPASARAAGPEISGDTLVTPSADALGKAVFVTNQVDLRGGGNNLLRGAVETVALSAMVTRGVPRPLAVDAINYAKSKMTAIVNDPDPNNPFKRPTNTGFAVFNSIDQILSSAPLGIDCVWTIAREGAKQGMWLMTDPDPADPLLTGKDATNSAPQGVLDVYADARVRAMQDPEFRRAWDDSVGKETNSDAGASIDAMIATDPVLAGQKDIISLLQKGSLKLDDLKTKVIDDLGSLDDEIAGARGQLRAMDQQQKDILGYLKDEQKARLAAEAAEKEAKARQSRIDASRAGLYLLTQAVGTIDPKAAKQLNAIGGAAIDIATTVSKWAGDVASLGLVDKIFNLGTVIATGNIVSAVSQLVSSFMGGQSGEGAILEEVKALRHEVEELHTDMTERFNRVDATLNTIYKDMTDRFDRIDAEFGKVTSLVQQTQAELLQVRAQLDRLEGNMFLLAQDNLLHDFNLHADGALGYQEHYKGAPIPVATFKEAESFFYSWATNDAKLGSWTAPEAKTYDNDGEVKDQLAKFPLEMNLNYLSGLTKAKWGRAFLSQVAPNPRIWALGARAYARLMSEWPTLANSISGSRAENLAALGETLRADLSRIALLKTSDGTNRLLLDALLDQYKGAVETLAGPLTTFETANSKAPDSEGGVDCLAGPDQPLTTQGEGLIKQRLGTSIQHLNDPSAAHALDWPAGEELLSKRLSNGSFATVPTAPAPYLLDVVLNDPTVNVCWDVTYPQGFPTAANSPAGGVIVLPVFLRVRVMYRLGDSTIVVRLRNYTVTSDHFPAGPDYPTRAYTWVRQNWTSGLGLKAQFLATPNDNIPYAYWTAAIRAGSLLNIEKGKMYGRVAAKMGAGITAVPGDLQTAITKVQSAKLQLSSILQLAMPNALQDDDLLQALLNGSGRTATIPPAEIPGDFLLQDLQLAYQAASNGPTSPCAGFQGQILDRLNVLRTRVGVYQQAISTGQRDESLPLLVTAAARARLAVPTVYRINVTSPTATSSWPSGSSQTLSWAVKPAYGAVGEFHVGLLNAAGTALLDRQVLPTVGTTRYSASINLTGLPAGKYIAYVHYRPTVGSGDWTDTGASRTFTVAGATISSLSPTTGPAAGGTIVTINGTNFTGVTAVKFGATAATIVTKSATKLTARAPAHAAGTVDVQVTTPLGTSTPVTADRFTYIAPTRYEQTNANFFFSAGWTQRHRPHLRLLWRQLQVHERRQRLRHHLLFRDEPRLDRQENADHGHGQASRWTARPRSPSIL